MKKEYVKTDAQRFEFDYSENVTASKFEWEVTNVSNPWYNCDSSYKDANGVCGYNGHNISNPNYVCNSNP